MYRENIRTDNIDEFLKWKKANRYAYIRPRSKREFERQQKRAYKKRIQDGKCPFPKFDKKVIKNKQLLQEHLKDLPYSLAVTFNFNRDVSNGNINEDIAKSIIWGFNSYFASKYISSNWYKKWCLRVIYTIEHENSNLHCHCEYFIYDKKTGKLVEFSNNKIFDMCYKANYLFRKMFCKSGSVYIEKPYKVNGKNVWVGYMTKAFSNNKNNTDRIDYI